MRPSRTATSANTPTSGAPRACWIFSTRREVTGRRSSLTGRRWLPICWRSNNFARPSGPGACHEKYAPCSFGAPAWNGPAADGSLRARSLQFGPAGQPDDLVFDAGIEIPDPRVVHDSARPDVARTTAERSEDQADAHAAAYR